MMADNGNQKSRTSWPMIVRGGFVALLALGLVACGSSKKNKDRLTGDRISVLTFEQRLEADPRISDIQVQLPKPVVNQSWKQAGGNVYHAMHHLSLSDNPKKVWSSSIGKGSSKRARLTSAPVSADDRIFTIDTDARVSAFRTDNGKRLWSVDLDKKGESDNAAFGGGIALDGDRVYANTGYGFVAAMDASTGREVWREDIGVPLRGAPTVTDGRVFSITYDNQIYALNANDGSIIWNEVGIAETASILGSASPAVDGNTLVAAYSSGEIYAMRVENGRTAWTDALTRTGRLTALATLSDIDGEPVIDRGRIYAASHSGRMVAIDLRSGERVWERNIGSAGTPWIVGEFIYVVTVDSEVACLSRRDGRIRWVHQLQRYKKQNKRKGLLDWAGPVVAGDRVIVASSHGYALSISPYTGELISGMKLPDDVHISPIVVDNTLYVLTDDGKLVAMR